MSRARKVPSAAALARRLAEIDRLQALAEQGLAEFDAFMASAESGAPMLEGHIAGNTIVVGGPPPAASSRKGIRRK